MMVERVDGKSVLEIAAEQNGFQKCVDAKVDINSSNLSSTKTSQKKKRRRKKRKLSDSTISSVGSIEEGTSLSCVVEPLSCVGEQLTCVIEPPSCVDASSTTKKKRRKKKKKISDSTLGSLGSIKEGASPTCVDVNSTVNQGNDHSQVDINSCELSNVKTNQGKKRRRNKRKLYNSTVSNLGSIQEGAFPAVLVVEDSSVRDGYSDHSNKVPNGYLETIMGDEVAGNAISTKNNDDHDQADINSCDLSSVKRNQGKKRRRKRKKFSDSTMNSSEPIEEGAAPSVLVVEDKSISCLESIKEGASLSALVVQDSSVRDTSSDPLYEAPAWYSDKITGEKLAVDGTSFLVAGNISIGKASCECLGGESAYGEQEKNIKMENLEKLTNGHIVEKNASLRKKRRRKRIKFSDSAMNSSEPIKEVAAPSVLVVEDKSISCLESIKEGASPSILVAQDSSVRDTSSDPLDEAPGFYSGKITGEKVGGDGPSFLVAGNISIGKASCECLDGESAYVEQEKKIKMENLDELTNGHIVEKNASQGKKRRRKRTKFSDSIMNSSEPIKEGAAPSVLVVEDKSIGCLESIKEGASPSKLVVQDSSVRDTSSDPLDEAPACYSDKVTEEKVGGDGPSFLVAGNISIGKASCECLDGESAYREQEKKIKMENLEELTNGHIVEKNASQGKKRRRKRIKFSDSRMNSSEPIVEVASPSVLVVEDKSISFLESIKEGASPSVLVLQDSSVRDTSSDPLDEAPVYYSDKITREKVAGDGPSFLVAGNISIGKASYECLDGESAYGEQEKKIKMENLDELTNGHIVEKNASWVDLAGKEIEQGNEDKSSTICEDKASDGASGADSSVDNLESDNLGVKPKLSDEIPSSSVLGVITDNDSLAVAVKEGPLPKLESSPPGSLRKKLLVLDVNGLLADIVACVSGRYKPDTFVSGKAVFKRPFYDDFLQFCFERFHVAVWSSRTKKNVKSVLDFLMGKSKHNLLFCWDQSHCTYTGFNTVEDREKPLLLKELNKIWEKHDPDLPWARGYYNKSNTLLLDDSPYKALRNPPNTAIFPHSYRYKNVNDNSLGPGGDLRVYLERLALADDVQKYVELNPFGQRPITKTNLSWSFYLKIIRPTSSLEEDTNDSLPLQ
ncbi:Uro-adherence factor A like [Actinidia chinensis var. chinensis]|uniref:Uro-adherence factor A like n=1 Tax=Actinidia chinensis var. chinensis TaxID=1590841 RepID=A0A2R6PCI7_ACTCC|nr:Uro-adherence factor A like [Actinidia chinensis var. chinensis]